MEKDLNHPIHPLYANSDAKVDVDMKNNLIKLITNGNRPPQVTYYVGSGSKNSKHYGWKSLKISNKVSLSKARRSNYLMFPMLLILHPW